MEQKLIDFVKPQKLGGKRGFEEKYIRDFEKTVFFLTPHMSINPKESTVREFFTAFFEVKKRAEKEIMARQSGKRKSK